MAYFNTGTSPASITVFEVKAVCIGVSGAPLTVGASIAPLALYNAYGVAFHPFWSFDRGGLPYSGFKNSDYTGNIALGSSSSQSRTVGYIVRVRFYTGYTPGSSYGPYVAALSWWDNSVGYRSFGIGVNQGTRCLDYFVSFSDSNGGPWGWALNSWTETDNPPHPNDVYSGLGFNFAVDDLWGISYPSYGPQRQMSDCYCDGDNYGTLYWWENPLVWGLAVNALNGM